MHELGHELLEDDLENSTHIKLCPFCGSAGVAYKSERANVLLAKCINAECYLNDVNYFPLDQWNQRQPHPDSVILDWMIDNEASVYKSVTGQGYKCHWEKGEDPYGGKFHDTPREAIQQAMEQEK